VVEKEIQFRRIENRPDTKQSLTQIAKTLKQIAKTRNNPIHRSLTLT